MRKLLISAAVAALSAGGALAFPAAHAVSDCGTGVNPGTLGSTSGTVRVGVQGVGCLTGSGSAGDLSGYVVADGSPSNAGALAGYIGVTRDGSGVTLVGCSRGDFDEVNRANNKTIDPANPAPTADCPLP